MTEERLAIIKEVQCGVGDYGKAALWFTTYISDCSAALQVIEWEDAAKLIESSGVRHVDSLNGKSCYVEVGNGLIRFKRMAKL